MKHERLELDIDDLFLDLQNPRTGEVASQSDALAAVIRLSAKNFRNMMRSIKNHGLDPGDAFYLIQEDPEDSSFTVVDGNRRLAALKVLKNPLLLKGTSLSEAMTKPLVKEAEGFKATSDFTVDCVLFDSREDAKDWIERRHGRGMEGEGRIHWSALDIQRFQNDHSVLDVIQFVEKNSKFNNDEWAGIRAGVEKNSSTLKRFLDSKPGKQNLGISAQKPEKGPAFTQDENFVIDALSQIFLDISKGEINTRSHNKSSDIEEYFDNLDPPLKSKSPGHPKPFGTTLISKDKDKRPRQRASAAASSSPTKTKKIPLPRATLAPTRLPFAAPDGEKGKQLFREAAKLRLKETPLSSAYCFRAIIEFSIDTYMRNNKLPTATGGTELHLATRVEHVVQHIYQNGRAPKGDLNPVKATLTSKTAPTSVAALNGYIHSKFQMTTADDLRVAWENAVPLFIAIFGPAK